MNSFGNLFNISIYGESHGRGVGIVVDGCPAGVSLDAGDFEKDFARRRSGRTGTTPRKERDLPLIVSGVFRGHTTGSPINIMLENRDVRSGDYSKVTRVPRPGHADLVAMKKYGGYQDYRGGGHFSGRLTAGIVAAGVIAKKIIRPAHAAAKLIQAGGSKDVKKAVETALKKKDSVGGIVECRITNLPAGLGEPFFGSVESLMSHILFSIPAIKGVEFGSGFGAASMTGSEHNDPIIDREGTTLTNHAGGINGGISNGNEVLFRVAVKPTSSISRSQSTINLGTGKMTDLEIEGRHDVCIALRVPVVVEAAAAVVLADLSLIEQNINRVYKS